MAHLFVERNGAHDAPAGWQPRRLDDRSPFPLNGPPFDPDCPEHERQGSERVPGAEPSQAPAPAVVAGVSAGGRLPRWLLLGPRSAGVSINGRPALLGIRVLENRDRIVVDCATEASPREYYFSTEEPAAIEPFSGPPVLCPRCKTPIEPGDPAVRCPVCGFWHHQIEPSAQAHPDEPSRQRPCWTYLDRCANCGAPTALDGALTWTPDEL